MLIDAGNSRLKWTINKKGKWLPVSYETYCVSTRVAVILQVIARVKPSFILLVHVLGNSFENEICLFCKHNAIKLRIVTARNTSYGVKNAYSDASKLGADRFVGLIAVYHQNTIDKGEGRDSIVISCGTAVTIDAISKQGEHLGGVILPGLQLWKEMLINGTELLQQTDGTATCVFATSTGQGITAGSLYGLAGAIDRICNEMKPFLMEPVVLILTGGGAEFLRPYLKDTYKLSPNLVIKGLKIITEIDNA